MGKGKKAEENGKKSGHLEIGPSDHRVTEAKRMEAWNAYRGWFR